MLSSVIHYSARDVLSLNRAGISINVTMKILSVSLFTSYFLSAQVKLDGKSPYLFRGEFNYIRLNINIASHCRQTSGPLIGVITSPYLYSFYLLGVCSLVGVLDILKQQNNKKRLRRKPSGDGLKSKDSTGQ